MTKRTSDSGWETVIGGLAQLAIVGGAAYVMYQAREAYLGQLVTSSASDAIKSLLETVPGMDDTIWNLFFNGLQSRAQISYHANELLTFAVAVRKTALEIDHILSKPIPQAKIILDNIISDMDDATWNIFRSVLEMRSTDQLQARALLNYANNCRSDERFAEDLFRESLRAALVDGFITSREASDLEALRRKLNISSNTARHILSEVKNGGRPDYLSLPHGE